MARKSYQEIVYKENGLSWITFPEICKSCGLCILKCPKKCLSYDSTQNEYLGMPTVKCKIDDCIACRTCEQICPEGAIKVEGKK